VYINICVIVRMEEAKNNSEEKKKEEEASTKNNNKKKTEKGLLEKDEPELSDEDRDLKDGLELSVKRLRDPEVDLHQPALDYLISEIRKSTSSMTAVPKPLKFLNPHYIELKSIYTSWAEDHNLKKKLADVLAVLAMTMAPLGSRESLRYKLQGTSVDIASWGHEFCRFIGGEVAEEFSQRMETSQAAADDGGSSAEAEDSPTPVYGDLISIMEDIVPFQMKHNAETEAIDLLIEIKQLRYIVDKYSAIIDDRNYERVCLYMIKCADYESEPEDVRELYQTAFVVYKNQGKYTDALRIALKTNDNSMIAELFSGDLDIPELVQRQMAFLLAGHRSSYVDERSAGNLNEVIGNSQLSSIFSLVAKTMTLSDPKTPEDIYKIKTKELSRYGSNLATSVDSAKGNLASTFVNAFVNAGHGRDAYMLKGPGAAPVDWIHRNKDHGKISAIASMGMVLLWNPTDAYSDADKYFHQNDEMIKAGAALAIGIASTGVRDENNATSALLDEYIDSRSQTVKLNAILSLGIAYAGTNMQECKDKLLPIIANNIPGAPAQFIESAFAALALGMIFVGSSDPVSEDMLMRLLEADSVDLANPIASKYFCLGLGLLYLNKTEDADTVIQTCGALHESIMKFAVVTIEACAYAGTGTVLKVQSFLKQCVEHLTEKADHQAMAVLGIALVVLGEDVGTQMSLRSFDHLLQYGELPVKRVVPLSLALLHLSNPDYQIVDQLSRLSHDQDHVIAQNAIFGLGLVSAGTNNSRIAGLLRQLAEYYSKEANHLFIVRIAQGLNAIGKGLIGINPFHSDRLLMNKAAMAGILTVFIACLEIKLTILDKYHYLLFAIATAMSPRFLVTLNSNDEIEPVSVRVGQAVETVGQAGKPKTITGFQTHATPVLLGPKDRAILANREYLAHSSVLEGVVIVEKNPEEEAEAAVAAAAAAGSGNVSRASSASSSAAAISLKK